eukprot:TRINITY_DN1306_c0_g1_i13.p1 TRINITY_DN1306_c0_g1~~TRINITY_DN1306_c0_g1_i13.p1  ORF type:complete len:186 (+),score=22.75 TRINITY_DN1306_c0_g1_i13:321-878(+)
MTLTKLLFQLNVIAYEYKGYGIASGSTTAHKCKNDEKCVLDFLCIVLKVDLKNIILFGRSIGTGPASHVAGRIEKRNPNSMGGLILQSPYTSIRDMAKLLVGMVGTVAPNLFDNEKHMKYIKCPVLFIHGQEDTLIPSSHSERLHAICPSENKNLRICPGSDHNIVCILKFNTMKSNGLMPPLVE